MINRELLKWEARVKGPQGFRSIATPHDTKLNQKSPALRRPSAVRAVDIKKEVPDDVEMEPEPRQLSFRPHESAAGPRVRSEDLGKALVPKGLSYFEREKKGKEMVTFDEMELQTISLGSRPRKRRKMEFYLEDSHRDDPDETGTGTPIHSQTWVWGALLLLLLVVVTFRHRF